MKALGLFILGLISTTFAVIIFLFALSYFPNSAISAFATSLLAAGSAILGAIPDIVGFVLDRIRAR
jgi:hypothetical protein